MKKDNKYKALYYILQTGILKGEFKPGSILPSESELKEAYNVTQPTIRHALDLLVKDRLIKKHHGKGSIVQPRNLGIGIINFEGHSVASQNDDNKIHTKIIHAPNIIDWPDSLHFDLSETEAKAKVIEIDRVRTLNRGVVFLEKVLIPDIKMKGFCSMNLNDTSLYDTLGLHFNIFIKNSHQKIWAIAADKHIAKLLKIKEGSPIVRMERRLETNHTGFNIYSSLWANTDHYMLYNHS